MKIEHREPTKVLYFIRHGEDEQGKAQVYQGADSPLTEHGRRQAQLVARWAKKFKAEHIITSPMARALETARAIQSETALPLNELDLVREYIPPSEFIGTSRLSDESNAFTMELFANMHDPSWHRGDEENYFDMHTRAVESLEHLKAHPASRVLVVTHAGFMRVLLSAMMSDGMPNPELAMQFMRFLKPKNTGITEVHWHPEAQLRNTWRLVTLNETTHLSEAGDTEDNSASALPI